VDALVVVARHHQTDKRQLKELKRRFHDGAKFLGIVINRVNVRPGDHYYQQYYYYGYGKNVSKK